MSTCDQIVAIAIGRNEGARLVHCLNSLQGRVDRIIYVDSGSEDGSLAAAENAGAEIVILDTDLPFTAARARNAGLDQLKKVAPCDYVQFLDGDCELHPEWLDAALQFLQNTPRAAVVCGRRRERFPEASVYNRLIDLEWDTPIGKARACGGDALMRYTALQKVGGFNPVLIAGEEPELCVRIRKAGWEIWRIETEMTLHDAQMTRFSQWWKRAKRAGHAYAEGSALHGAPPERHNVTQTRRALIWGLAIPGAIVLIALLFPWALALLLLYPLQTFRLALRNGDWIQAGFLTLSKFPETVGILTFVLNRLRSVRATLIEYK